MINFNNTRKYTSVKFNSAISCGIAFNYHDSSVSFAYGNKIILVLEAERIFRVKKKMCNRAEMEYLIKYGLRLLKKNIGDVNYWTMTTFNNPYLSQAATAINRDKQIREPYWNKVLIFGVEKEVLIINHHLAHAGIYLATKYKNALIISCDGGGDINPIDNTNECLVIFKGDKNKIIRQDLESNNYISGKTYGICSTFIYSTKLHDKYPSEGKLMALASLGKVEKKYNTFFKRNFNLIEKADYPSALKILADKFPDLRGKATIPTKSAMNFAATLHQFFIRKRLDNISYIIKNIYSNEEALILTGGTGLNIDLNTKVKDKFHNLKHFIAPCCDDTGQSVGALCILINDVFNLRTQIEFPYLGEGKENFKYTQKTLDKAVDILMNDGILILHNGKAEIGPRALGNRSFIARPDSLEIKNKLSIKIKKRESYRPVAPSVLENKVGEYFIGPNKSPFMLYRYSVIKSQIKKVVGAIHIDRSARVQTVSHKDNPFLYDLIKRFGKRTGIYAVLNTSLNLHKKPLTNKIGESLNIYNKIDGPKGIIYNGKIIKHAITS